MKPTLDGAHLWLERAREHIDQVSETTDRLVRAELGRLENRIKIEQYPSDLPSVTFSQRGTDVSLEVGVLVGESLQALRRALDYLVFEIAFLDSGSEQAGTQFPADYDREQFWRRRDPPRDGRGRGGALVGVKDGHMEVLGRYQPFSLEHWVRQLVDYSNPDKHRRLSVTEHQIRSRVMGSADRSDPEISRDGAALVVSFRTDSDFYAKIRITPFVAFDDGESVEETLRLHYRGVADVLAEFEPCFRRGCQH